MALIDLQKKLLDQKVIDITGDITQGTREYVREALMILSLEGRPRVTITINSGGGNASAGLDTFDLIRFYPGQKLGIALTAAGSAANTILQACDWRVATPNGHILVHHTKMEISWDVLVDDNKRAKFIEANKKHFNIKERMAKRANKTMEEIISLCDDNRWISSKEALEFGLIDEIVETVAEIKFPTEPAIEGPP